MKRQAKETTDFLAAQKAATRDSAISALADLAMSDELSWQIQGGSISDNNHGTHVAGTIGASRIGAPNVHEVVVTKVEHTASY